MDKSILDSLNENRANRRACVVVTNLNNGETSLFCQTDHAPAQPDELAAGMYKAFSTGKAQTITTHMGDLFINPHVPPVRFVVIGAVHITQALARIAAAAGYMIEIIDPRTAFATPERFAGFDLHDDWPMDAFAKRPLDPFCALAAVTHDPKIDDDAIRAALEAKCFYVGALGSRKTHGKRLARLQEKGVSEQFLGRIHSPIGLDIAAASPGEIAVSIMAEIIEALRRRGER